MAGAVDAAPEVGPVLALVLVALASAAAVLARFGGLGLGRDMLVAAVRAAAQLAAVSLVIAAVLGSAGWTSAFIAGMVVVAAATAGHRVTGSARGRAFLTAAWWAALPIVAGVAPVLALLTASTLVPARPVAVLPIAGIFIGGAMSATGLTGRRALDELSTRRGEYEGGLALGLLARDAALEVCRPAAALALFPVLDQTRTVGLVTLPGAFVGVLLGGADPVEAGATQLLVLIGLLAIEAIAVLITLELVATGRLSRTRA
ncbi:MULTISPECIES: ABC transporter permease [Actinomadura]|uniref:ABC transporter permease n=1 Tax=Actinomadura litoris TaxID=2678616 RepID=A0A7K1KUG6_9ACTN|nr:MULTISPECIES: ABC transporter permease [Actinomadura]MBT2207379.1 ABC transporter permease [Actinomadura sp. NEAU-AAG7]MUN35812.1 ABC transporter permease [Actinomadura litoris]